MVSMILLAADQFVLSSLNTRKGIISRVKWRSSEVWAQNFYPLLLMNLKKWSNLKKPSILSQKTKSMLHLQLTFITQSQYLVHHGTGFMGTRKKEHDWKWWWESIIIFLSVTIAGEPLSHCCYLHLKQGNKTTILPWTDTAGANISVEEPAGLDPVLPRIKNLVRPVTLHNL